MKKERQTLNNPDFSCISAELKTKIDIAVKRLQSFEPYEGYWIAFSGGKDSQAIYHLAEMAHVRFDAHYAVTTVDPPPLVQFIHKHYPYVIFERHLDPKGNQYSMRSLILKTKTLPDRVKRFCCRYLKESIGDGSITVTGVRWEESANRRKKHGAVDIHTTTKKYLDQVNDIEGATIGPGAESIIMNDDNDASRRLVEQCYRTRKTILNPIVDWTEQDVWDFLNKVVKVPHCELYDRGWTRIGCIGCPMASIEQRERGFREFPTYEKMYKRCIEELWEDKALTRFGVDDYPKEEAIKIIWDWWLYGTDYPAKKKP